MSRVAEIFDEWARSGRAEGMERGHAPAARMAVERLRLGESARFLDIGCGNGYAVRWAASAAPRGRAVGVDLSAEMIEHAQLLSAGIPNAEFVVGSFPRIDPPGAPYDAIFSMEVFNYLPDLDAALRRAGLAVIDQPRLRIPREAATAAWKSVEGSLLTLGRR